MLGGIFANFFAKLAEGLLRRSSKKESEREIETQESAICFTVHNPKWVYPLLLICSAAFLGFAIFSFKYKVMIAAVIFIAFSVLSIFGLVWESAFKVKVDGQQITLSRLFGMDKTFYAKDIVSCHIDNSGNVTVTFESGKISVDGMKVNSNLFYSFAQGALYENWGRQPKRSFKVKRKKSEFIWILFSMIVSAVMLFIFISDYESFSIGDEILAFLIFGGIILLGLFYLPIVSSRCIWVDEENASFTYTKGFHRYTASFFQVIGAETKKRFGESNVNYILKIAQTDSLIIKKKFSSLDENAARFVNLLIRRFEAEDLGYYDAGFESDGDFDDDFGDDDAYLSDEDLDDEL